VGFSHRAPGHVARDRGDSATRMSDLQQSLEVAERIGAAFERDGTRLEHDRLHEITERRSR